VESLRGKVRVVKSPPKGVHIRYSKEEDSAQWGEWLGEPEVIPYFHMHGDKELADSVERMKMHAKYNSSLTAEVEGEVAGIAYLNLHPFRKIAHIALITIIVGEKFRGKGVGTALIEQLHRLAREGFRLEKLYLEVYEGNPAIRFYRRLGYREFGFQSHWIKWPSGEYRGKVFMDRWL